MKTKIFSTAVILLFASCKTVNPTAAPKVKILSNSKLASFASEAEFQEYMANLSKTMVTNRKNNPTIAYSKGSEPASEGSNSEITNNQEQGVDEGGIVKNIGDYLVVLHKGRLSAVTTANNELKETDAIPVARSTELQKNVWYDELLVKGDHLYVVGYRYHTDTPSTEEAEPCKKTYNGATEINSYSLKDGKFQRLQTRFLESADYYSSENYASRMIDGHLVFYMPQPAFTYCAKGDQAQVHLPQELNYDTRAGFSPIKSLFSGTEVYKNIEVIEREALFHSIVNCGLPEDGTLDCKAKAVLGDYSRKKYVTKDSVYLATAKKIYALGLKDLNVRAHGSLGAPVNQFSFKEMDNDLYVISEYFGRSDSEGSTSSGNSCSIRLLKLPLVQFDAAGDHDVSATSSELYKDTYCSISQNRFVGRYALVGRYLDNSEMQEVIVVNTDNNTKRIQSVGGYLGRIEVLSDEMAFITIRRGDGSLEVSSLRLDNPELKLSSLKLGKSAEGESRSHGFFQKTQDDGGHLIGLPVLSLRADDNAWWGHGLSNVAFIQLASNETFKLLGTAESGKDPSVCQSSCIDWYGNTRPIFLGNRLFALMGHEIAEVKLTADGVTPAGRVQMFGKN